MRETVIRLIATAAILCGGTNLGWAQEAGTLHGRELVALGNRLPMWLIQTHESWSKRGVYALFASRSGLAILEAGGFRAGSDRLVYVGKTENSFAERLARHRTGGSNLSAPLKRALGANATQLEVSRFIQTHLKVGLLPLDDRARINAVETELIKSRGPPLNTAGVNGAGGTPVIRTTSGIRTMRMLVKGAAIIAAAEVPNHDNRRDAARAERPEEHRGSTRRGWAERGHGSGGWRNNRCNRCRRGNGRCDNTGGSADQRGCRRCVSMGIGKAHLERDRRRDQRKRHDADQQRHRGGGERPQHGRNDVQKDIGESDSNS